MKSFSRKCQSEEHIQYQCKHCVISPTLTINMCILDKGPALFHTTINRGAMFIAISSWNSNFAAYGNLTWDIWKPKQIVYNFSLRKTEIISYQYQSYTEN
jgi:hypothetical protein